MVSVARRLLDLQPVTLVLLYSREALGTIIVVADRAGGHDRKTQIDARLLPKRNKSDDAVP